MASSEEVYQHLLGYLQRNGGASRNWYAGIATDVEQRLFGDHNVSREGYWAHHTADTEDGARAVEQALLRLGCSGAPGGGDRPRAVYVYWKTLTTRE